ncbi:1-acyl-sn-glycerol-3-phosphate acyltransferase [Melghirimyces profundicolus]|uniref:1-acyl-sn-glycerol-3-phosphate acyltransferase n=1 Tax=Melghirimyces profundicolus TaxID=1242148 RepID=A0A2T6BUZ4_9BACL|nr:lysophospholipid acyltransferase family protein [Melghirimyces profundicolus]PTX59883.1 1-acyl-sn-glycerol-3-phosphate acyltransferase [Melghirimyces profundicolus]
MWYRCFHFLFRVLFSTLYRVEIRGAENIPSSGPVVVCCNHINTLDPPLLGSAMERPVRFMAKRELFDIPVLSFLIRRFGAFPVNRGATDKRALKQALEVLKQGEVLGVFPEGTRSKSGKLGKAHTGAAFIALKGGARLVPAAIIGPYRLFRPIRVHFGSPMDLEDYRGERLTSETLRRVTEKMMEEIQDLLSGACRK